MIPTYASHRQQPPQNSFTVSSISGTADNASRTFYIQYANRSGYSLLSYGQTVFGTGVEVTLNSDLILSSEEVFWIIISYESTYNSSDAAIVYQWQARGSDQIVRRVLPYVIQFTTPEHFVNDRTSLTTSDLPYTGILPGAIAYVAETNKYYRYDPEAYFDASGKLISYGTNHVQGVNTNWIEWAGTFDAFISETTGVLGSDLILSSVENALAVPAKIIDTDSIAVRYWFNNGFSNDGGSIIDTGKYSFEISVDGAPDYTTVFANKINFTLVGYINRDDMTLDITILDVGVVKVWNPVDGIIELPEPLPRNHAAVYDVVLSFNNDDLLGIVSTSDPIISLDVVEIGAIQGQVSPLGKIIGDLIFSEMNKFLIVPGPHRLSGVASFASGYIAEDPNQQSITGLQADTADQQAMTVGSLNGYVNIKQSGDPVEYSEVVRAVVSTETGFCGFIASSSIITLSGEGFQVIVTHPIDNSGLGIIRSNYDDFCLAGRTEVLFSPIQGYVFLDIDGNYYQSTSQSIGGSDIDTFVFDDIATFTPLTAIPFPTDLDFGLFEPVSVVLGPSGSSGNFTGTSVTAYFAYSYESPNYHLTKINHEATNAIPTAQYTLAEAINNSLIRSNNLSDVPDITIAQTNLDVYDRAYIDAHHQDTNNPHQVTTTQIGAATTADLAITNNRVTANEAATALNTTFRTTAGTGATFDAGITIGDLVQVEDVDGNGLAGLPAIDGSKLTGIGGQLTVEFVDGTIAALVDEFNPINYLIDTSAAVATVNLPAAPVDKGIVAFSDRNKTFGTNIATIVPDAAHTVDGQANFLLDFDGEAVTLVFDATNNNYVVLDGIQNTSTSAGDMSTNVYDVDNNGIVDSAEEVDGITTAGNDKFYGTDATGLPGFYDYLVGAAVKAALEAIADPNKLLFGAIDNARDITNQPNDDWCLTYDLGSDSLIYKPRIQPPGAGLILQPISMSIFETADNTALTAYVPDVGTALFSAVRIETTAGVPNNEIIGEELVINVVMTGAVIDLTVSDCVIKTAWTYSSSGGDDAIILRYSADGDMLIVALRAASVAVEEIVSDVTTSVVSESFTFVDSTAYKIEVRVVGVTVAVWIDDVEIIAEAITNEFLTATSFGVGRLT